MRRRPKGLHENVELTASGNPALTGALFLAGMITTFDQSATVVALPAVRDAFDTGVGPLVWVQLAGAVPGAALAIQAGGLGDRFGRGRVILAGIALLLMGSLLSAFAVGPTGAAPLMLIAGRFVAGAGDTVITVLAVALLTSSVSPLSVGRTAAVWTTMTSGFAALSPLFSGLIVDSLGWRFVFGLPAILITVVAMALIAFRPDFSPATATRPNVIGSVTLAFSMLLLTAGITSLETLSADWPKALMLCAAAVVLLSVAIVSRNRSKSPTLQRSTLGARGVKPALIGRAIVALGFGGAMFEVSLLLLNVLDYRPTAAGAMSIPPALASVASSATSGRTVDRMGVAGAAALGCTAISVGIAWLSTIAMASPSWMIAAALTIVGAGNGLLSATVTATVLSALPTAAQGQGSGLLLFASFVPGVVGFSLVVVGASLAMRSRWSSEVTGSCRTDGEVLSDLTAGAFSDIADACGAAAAAAARAAYLMGTSSVLRLVAVLIGLCAIVLLFTLRTARITTQIRSPR